MAKKHKIRKQKHKKPIAAYVVDLYGCPLMPCRSKGRVSRMLKSKKAHIMMQEPFTIQLDYEPKTHVTNAVVHLGDDPGRTNIGLGVITENGEVLYSCKIETRNKEIASCMRKRKMYRQASRNGRRQRRKRRAQKYGTFFLHIKKTGLGRRPIMSWSKKHGFRPLMERKLPECEEMSIAKDIKNKESRFCNRTRPEGWLTPTVRQLLITWENAINLVLKILPVTDISVELNKFSFARMENPDIRGEEFQNGPMKGFSTVEEAVAEQQNDHCIFCKKAISHIHHIKPLSRGGSHTLANCAGLCDRHHDLIHKETDWFDKMVKKKSGLEKKYAALSAVNQAIPYFWKWLQRFEPFIHIHAVNGWETKAVRERYALEKDHHIDAWCIAVAGGNLSPTVVEYPWKTYHVMQFRRHSRARIKCVTSRTYYLGDKKVAVNRHKAVMAIPKVKKDGTYTINEKVQDMDSLEEFRNKLIQEYGEKEACQIIGSLRVEKSRHVYNNMDRVLPGAVFTTGSKRKGTVERHVLRGNHSGGKGYIIARYGVEELKLNARRVRKHAEEAKLQNPELAPQLSAAADALQAQLPKDKEYQVKDCKVRKRNTGLVYVTETY